MWTITGFADEIAQDLNEQLDTLVSEKVGYLELRAAWGVNVLDLSDEQVAQVKKTLAERGIKVSSIGSPIGKIDITDPFEPHLERFRRALWCAKELDAPFIRIFSFWIPDGKFEEYRPEVMRRMTAIAKEAEGTGITLLHENEKHIYGDVPKRCLDIVESVQSPALRVAWDPANFVQCGVRPFTEGYEMLRPYIAYVHVKDFSTSRGQVTPVGEGDGEFRETVRALRDSGFDGFFSMEPHLQTAGEFSGFSGPELFKKALHAFRQVLQDEGIPWQ